jgi:hypothetical protein
MASSVYFQAILLNAQEKLSPREFTQIVRAKSREEMAKFAGELYKSRCISEKERDALISAMVQDLLSGCSAKVEEQAKLERANLMTNRDNYCDGVRRGSPAVQGGLPSLGRRRP